MFGNVWIRQSFTKYSNIESGIYHVSNRSHFENTDKTFITFAYVSVILHNYFYGSMPSLIIYFFVKAGIDNLIY
jgi:hypothetical protein